MASYDINADMIDASLTKSLPAQVAALSEARKENAAELARLQVELTDLEGKVVKGKEEKKRLAIEVNCLLSKLHALEEEGQRRQLNTSVLQKEITRAVTLNADLKLKLVEREDESSTMEKKCTRHGEKLDLVKRKTSLYENAEAVMKELKMIRILTDSMVARKEQLEKCCTDMNTGQTIQKQIETEDIVTLETSVNEQKALLNCKLKELEDCQQERKQLEIDNHILQKKNAALLIRLKNQVKEQKAIVLNKHTFQN
ncbi:early endosome antigen 1-like isoform X1 [Biomphalaria glabrata]|uniref:Early endosome antigen 1-like isoform X1 n=1 Tax=Biomphalaria glabrata TaxID=6526 RepID=A0A9W3A9H7_BIOGL|nr:early endosome antigen 1-like isoform X1 [Biomphalaria glabrata]